MIGWCRLQYYLYTIERCLQHPDTSLYFNIFRHKSIFCNYRYFTLYFNTWKYSKIEPHHNLPFSIKTENITLQSNYTTFTYNLLLTTHIFYNTPTNYTLLILQILDKSLHLLRKDNFLSIAKKNSIVVVNLYMINQTQTAIGRQSNSKPFKSRSPPFSVST